ncbi:MAG TPA: hypothetical protein VF988_11425, partial [Verrucomicrobiae bacterium]
MEYPEEFNAPGESRHLWIWPAAIAILVILGCAAWFGPTAYRHMKERRSQAQAQEFLAKHDYRSALLSAQQALALNPMNVAASRVMAALADLSHNPAALDYQQRIVQAEPTVANKLALAATALRYQNPPYALTAAILNELSPAATNLPAYQMIAAGLAVNLRQFNEAEIHFETAAKLEPTNQLYALNLAILRLGMSNEVNAAESRAVLEKFCNDPNYGSMALHALVVDRMTHQDMAGANAYSTQLLASARATVADRLQHLDIVRQLDPAGFPGQIQALQQQSISNPAAVGEIAAWMQANGLRMDAFHWLTNLPAGIRTQPPIRLSLAELYLQNNNAEALRDFVSKGDWGEMEFLRLALAAHAWSQLDQLQVAESNWGAAVNEAGNRISAFTLLLGLTERWNLPRKREDLLQRMVEKFPRETWPRQALEHEYLADGDTPALNQLYAKLMTQHPDNTGSKNNFAYTSLLLKTNLAAAGRLAREVYA